MKLYDITCEPGSRKWRKGDSRAKKHGTVTGQPRSCVRRLAERILQTCPTLRPASQYYIHGISAGEVAILLIYVFRSYRAFPVEINKAGQQNYTVDQGSSGWREPSWQVDQRVNVRVGPIPNRSRIAWSASAWDLRSITRIRKISLVAEASDLSIESLFTEANVPQGSREPAVPSTEYF